MDTRNFLKSTHDELRSKDKEYYELTYATQVQIDRLESADLKPEEVEQVNATLKRLYKNLVRVSEIRLDLMRKLAGL